MKTILVSGDLVTDINIVSLANAQKKYQDPNPASFICKAPGGAWLTAQLIRKAFKASDCDVVCPDEIKAARLAVDAYSIWAPHKTSLASKELQKKKTWRIREFLGCQPRCGQVSPEDVEVMTGFVGAGQPDLVVLDDLAICFRHHPEYWSRALEGMKDAAQIILKAGMQFAQSPLWEELARKQLDRLTVVVSVDTLREQGAGISRSQSWDYLLEDLNREMTTGESSRSLGLAARVFIRVGLEAVAVYERGRLQRFVYVPDQCEGSIQERVPGKTFGALSLLTANVARHLLDPGAYPLFVAVGRALACMSVAHEEGAGKVDQAKLELEGFNKEAMCGAELGKKMQPLESDEKGGVADGDLPERKYAAAYPAELFSHWKHDAPFRLLALSTGQGYECMYAKALEIVQRGLEKALPSAPRASYGGYTTVDREEIERINDIRRLILAYKRNVNDQRPLSVAVFGQPGSGKSFAVKQLAKGLFPDGLDEMTFNLTQVTSSEDLCAALQRIRNTAIKGTIPLVFWDEFDTEGLKWLKDFLAPMQDGEFLDRGTVHNLGRCIFVFAGGTANSYDEFCETNLSKKAAKCPDFVSRLRGYLNVKGPNPTDKHAPDAPPKDPAQADDVAHVIRRGVLMRSLLDRHAPHLIDGRTRVVRVDACIIRAFLRVGVFKHGARSLESILTMSDLQNTARLSLDDLPSSAFRQVHVSADFDTLLGGREFGNDEIERIAEGVHNDWYEAKKAGGTTWAPKTDKVKNTNQYLLKYHELSDEGKDRNRVPARNTLAMFWAEGFVVVPTHVQRKDWEDVSTFEPGELDKLVQAEHDIWLRERLPKGVVYGPKTDERLQVHVDACHFRDLPADDVVYDRSIIVGFPANLARVGFKLMRRKT